MSLKSVRKSKERKYKDEKGYPVVDKEESVNLENSLKQVKEVGANIIGMSKGYTLNMGDYESARIEVWANFTVDETTPKAIKRGMKELSEVLDDAIQEEITKLGV